MKNQLEFGIQTNGIKHTHLDPMPQIDKRFSINNKSSNYIDGINYTSFDAKGNKYQITAEQAEIDYDKPDVMFLENIIMYIEKIFKLLIYYHFYVLQI